MEEYEQSGRRFRVGGLVTSSRSGISRRGLDYGVFTVQDYSGSYEFFMGGKNFLNNKGLIQNGNFLRLHISFNQTRSGEIRHSVDAMDLLRESASEAVVGGQLYDRVAEIAEV